jgi:hypothetical protein
MFNPFKKVKDEMSKYSRNLAKETLTLGNPKTFNLPKNYPYRRLLMKISGTVDVVAGNSAMTAVPQGAANLLSSITVRRDGKDSLFALGGLLAYELNRIQYGLPNTITNAAVTNATNVAVQATVLVPFENVNGVNPFDTLLNGKGLSSLDLLIETVSAQNLMYGGNGSVSVNTPFTLSIDSVEEFGGESFIFDDLKTYLAHKVPVIGASQSFQIKPITVGNFYKSLMLVVEDAGASGIQTNDIINNIQLKAGRETIIDIPAAELQNDVKTQMKLASYPAGVYYLDLMPDGRLNQALDVTRNSGRESLELILDVNAPSGACNISVVAQEYVKAAIVSKK